MSVIINGGLGNQMFQYAFKLKLDLINNCSNKVNTFFYKNKTVHNGLELEKIFNISLDIDNQYKMSFVKKILLRLFYKFGIHYLSTPNTITEVLIGYKDVNKIKRKKVFDGFWQSEDYFSDLSTTIRNLYVFPKLDVKNAEISKIIVNSNSISIHIRRGDFLGNSKFICLGKTNYYYKAIELIKKKIHNPIFFVFSDDIEWCKTNFSFENKAYFIDWNNNDDSYRDMQLMSLCKHNIIANSSFSWWGAWLNNHYEKIVIAPKKFYKGNKRDESHLIPKNWIKIGFEEI